MILTVIHCQTNACENHNSRLLRLRSLCSEDNDLVSKVNDMEISFL